jgi:hypothetical protein
MTQGRSSRPGRGPVGFTARPRLVGFTARPRLVAPSDLSAGSLRWGHGVKFLSAWLAAALALSACGKKAAELTAPEAAGGEGASDDIGALERELDLRERQLASLGAAPARAEENLAGGGGQGVGQVAKSTDYRQQADEEKGKKRAAGADSAGEPEAQAAPSTAPPEPTAPRRDAPQDRCTTVCELSAAICQLEDRICGLAPRHPDEPRYQAACERATRDCQSSQEACHACA